MSRVLRSSSLAARSCRRQLAPEFLLFEALGWRYRPRAVGRRTGRSARKLTFATTAASNSLSNFILIVWYQLTFRWLGPAYVIKQIPKELPRAAGEQSKANLPLQSGLEIFMRHKLTRSPVRTAAATQLIDTLHRYVYGNPLDINEKLMFEDIPLTEYALAAAEPLPQTALHKVLFDLAYNGWYMAYDDLEFAADLLPEARNFLSITFQEMRIPMPLDFATEDPDAFRVARDKYAVLFVDGLYSIVNDAFAIAWQMRAMLSTFNECLAARIRPLKMVDDARLVADGRLPRINRLPSWLMNALQARETGLCHECGRTVAPALGSTESPHFDHVIALAHSGGNDPTNFRVLCAACNLQRGAKPVTIVDEFAWPNARPN